MAALAAVGALAASRRQPALRTAGAGLLAVGVWAAWFFRDPVRRCPAHPDTLYAAADGVVLLVDEVDEDWHIQGRALRIATFLSAFDVHVNRCPAAARLVASRRDPGSFAPAFLRHGAEGNARQLLALEVDGRPPQTRRLVVAQIVGFMARRIVSWRLPGDRLAAGQKVGMIRFGSRTDVLAPAGAVRPLVRPGDRVLAGLTPIARYS
ncbi:MAG: Phosphatidylserine decarboxylase [uncultured Chloroflexi bacterium]|uniref:Phosphatidylserine decarboxylase n=1 Tax=uncultured Chloroflexota bacterium TaxID=166587 RepID=A0A6J4I168_9CHLR|nr:MAG: Phosphatidylserine decarboxylase [uncultured Chloroflexota bacterium]